MRVALISLVLLLAAGIGLALFLPDPPETAAVPVPVDAEDSFVWTTTDEPDAPVAGPQTRGPRAVAPERFAQPFVTAADGLERIAAREPLTPKPKEDTGPKQTPLFMPNVIAAGLIRYSQGDLRLDGIEMVEPDRVCTDPDGNVWPCGVIARTAFRNFLRGRALMCTVPGGQWEKPIVTECTIGGQDPAAWLAGNGWAPARPGTVYAKIATAAQNENRGIYGSDPRKEMPDIDSRVRVTLQPVPPPGPSQ